MELTQVSQLGRQLLENINSVMVGKEKQIMLVLTALFSGGHTLLEDVPGTGKTVLCKTLAASINGEFRRIQCTPDLLPSDITGHAVYQQKTEEFVFRPGPVFCNVLLADELNRATPRTQSALLEVMEEGQLSSDGTTYPLHQPFFVIATQNPVETQGTFPLPEAQLDRFLLRLSLGMLETQESLSLIDRFISDEPLRSVTPVISCEEILAIRKVCRTVFVAPEVREYIVRLTEATRTLPDVQLGVSSRGLLALLRASQTYSALSGRNYVIPDDVKALTSPVFCHRILLRSSFLNQREKVQSLVDELLQNISVPTEVPQQ